MVSHPKEVPMSDVKYTANVKVERLRGPNGR